MTVVLVKYCSAKNLATMFVTLHLM